MSHSVQSRLRLSVLERFSLDCRNWDWFWFWFWFYYALWLASVFTLVLVLRQSSENRSIAKEILVYLQNNVNLILIEMDFYIRVF